MNKYCDLFDINDNNVDYETNIHVLSFIDNYLSFHNNKEKVDYVNCKRDIFTEYDYISFIFNGLLQIDWFFQKMNKKYFGIVKNDILDNKYVDGYIKLKYDYYIESVNFGVKPSCKSESQLIFVHKLNKIIKQHQFNANIQFQNMIDLMDLELIYIIRKFFFNFCLLLKIMMFKLHKILYDGIYELVEKYGQPSLKYLEFIICDNHNFYNKKLHIIKDIQLVFGKFSLNKHNIYFRKRATMLNDVVYGLMMSMLYEYLKENIKLSYYEENEKYKETILVYGNLYDYYFNKIYYRDENIEDF